MFGSSSRLRATASLALALGLATQTAFALKMTIGGGGDAREVDLGASYDLAANPATLAQTYIVPRGKPKNVGKIGIVSVCVGLVDGRSVAGSSGPFTVSNSSPFPGTVDAKRLADVASDFRAQLAADLRAAGFEVLEHEDLAARPTYQKLAAKMTTDSFEVVDSYEVGKGTWANNRVTVLSPGGRPAFKDCRNIAPGTTMSLVKAGYEKDMDGITMLSASVTLDFAKAKAAGGFFRGAKADLDYGQYISPGIDSTAFVFAGKTGGGTLWLKQAIVAGRNPFAEGEKGSKSTTAKMDNEYDPNSGYTRSTSQSTSLHADMDLWYTNATSHLKALSGMLAQSLKSP
jgi:hypothetical protein